MISLCTKYYRVKLRAASGGAPCPDRHRALEAYTLLTLPEAALTARSQEAAQTGLCCFYPFLCTCVRALIRTDQNDAANDEAYPQNTQPIDGVFGDAEPAVVVHDDAEGHLGSYGNTEGEGHP